MNTSTPERAILIDSCAWGEIYKFSASDRVRLWQNTAEGKGNIYRKKEIKCRFQIFRSGNEDIRDESVEIAGNTIKIRSTTNDNAKYNP